MSTDRSRGSDARSVEVRIEGLCHAWSRDGVEHLVLDHIDLHVAGGEFMSIVGPSGCGKSTLLRIVAGLQAPSSGRTLIGGSLVQGPRADVGMVFQEASLYPWLTAAGNVAFGPRLKGVAGRDRAELAHGWLEQVGLADASSLYPHQLSGGMKQRVSIARALANGAQVLLMDEPFAALDHLARRTMQELLLRLWEEFHKTILFVTHHIEEAVLLSDRVAVLSPGPGARLQSVVRIEGQRPRASDGDWMEAEARRVRMAGRLPSVETSR